MRTSKITWFLACILALAGLSGAGPGRSDDAAVNSSGEKAKAVGPANSVGTLEINITDVLGHDLQARVELQSKDTAAAKPIVIEVPQGRVQGTAPPGTYKAYVYVYFLGVPIMVEAQDIAVRANETAYVLVNVLEGASENLTVFDFDRDCDFVIDRVEMSCGTDPADASSVPGRELLPLDERVLAEEEGWRRGELHAHSQYGIGQETVAQLVKRAEKQRLDFLAITDRNTMAACKDEAFKSDSVVLLPAMEWGSEERGVALIYGARTFPEFVDSIPQAQALVDLVQAQGGFFAVAHPCFPTAPWQWGLGYVNGVEIWCREWRAVPPVAVEQLNDDMTERLEGKLIHSIAFAAASSGHSANGQASVFYDAELVRGLKAAVIGGSYSANRKVPLASPVTYVYATEKSVRGILDGMRRGRTYVSSGLKGPKLHFNVDVLKDQKVDVSFGGVIPLGVPATFNVRVEEAKGKQLEVLLNGYPLVSKKIENNNFVFRFHETPSVYSVYRVRVIDTPKKKGFGAVEVLAISSPIYAQVIESDNPALEEYKRRRMEFAPQNEVALPPTPGPGEIIPTWRH